MNHRYEFKELSGTICLRVDIDDESARTTSTTHIPIDDLEASMKKYLGRQPATELAMIILAIAMPALEEREGRSKNIDHIHMALGEIASLCQSQFPTHIEVSEDQRRILKARLRMQEEAEKRGNTGNFFDIIFGE